ncbi:MAG: choice-of-anchor L domain-containing protein, partial [Phycisphaerales bacterium]|nr:choice-of-anchor L domain-containing protein [Phycisphaerales bacterium]
MIGPCAVVDASAGTFSSTGAGDCVVKADSAATTNYLASSAQQTVTISVPPLSIADTDLLDGFEGSNYPPAPQALKALGGVGPFTWAIDLNAKVYNDDGQLVPAILPPELSLDANTGIISGTPTTPGSFAFRVIVTDSLAQTAAHNFCIHVDPTLVASLVSKDLATEGETALNLATSLLDPDDAGVTVSNPSFAGSQLALGSFTGGGSATQGVGFDRGIILSSGAISGATGPNNTSSYTASVGSQPGDPDLTALAGNQSASQDAAILEFDFTPTCHEGTTCNVTFEYAFGSDEYPEYVGSQFNDVFGFFLTDVTAGGVKKNYALLPGTTTPVSINNVNGSNHSEFFRLNTGALNVQADGLTTPLQFSAAITSGHTYHIKIGISDIGDASYDSWVFIKSGSFKVT